MDDNVRLWHVTVTVAGASVEPLLVRGALQRLCEQRPFLSTVRFGSDRAEITYWDEAETLLDAASLGLRMWNEYRDSAALPAWSIVGLEVVEQDVRTGRSSLDGMIELNVQVQPF